MLTSLGITEVGKSTRMESTLAKSGGGQNSPIMVDDSIFLSAQLGAGVVPDHIIGRTLCNAVDGQAPLARALSLHGTLGSPDIFLVDRLRNLIRSHNLLNLSLIHI